MADYTGMSRLETSMDCHSELSIPDELHPSCSISYSQHTGALQRCGAYSLGVQASQIASVDT